VRGGYWVRHFKHSIRWHGIYTSGYDVYQGFGYDCEHSTTELPGDRLVTANHRWFRMQEVQVSVQQRGSTVIQSTDQGWKSHLRRSICRRASNGSCCRRRTVRDQRRCPAGVKRRRDQGHSTTAAAKGAEAKATGEVMVDIAGSGRHSRECRGSRG
jgi:hypothetical protein